MGVFVVYAARSIARSFREVVVGLSFVLFCPRGGGKKLPIFLRCVLAVSGAIHAKIVISFMLHEFRSFFHWKSIEVSMELIFSIFHSLSKLGIP